MSSAFQGFGTLGRLELDKTKKPAAECIAFAAGFLITLNTLFQWKN
jgi:hypothetical protein